MAGIKGRCRVTWFMKDIFKIIDCLRLWESNMQYDKKDHNHTNFGTFRFLLDESERLDRFESFGRILRILMNLGVTNEFE